MSTSHFKFCVFPILLIVVVLGRPPEMPAQSTTSAQAVSQTGLLPVYGVDFTLDPSWVDSTQFPSQSASYPNFGTSQTFQQVWDGLKASGFNVLRFPVDVRNRQGSVNRFSNLCLWAQRNNLRWFRS